MSDFKKRLDAYVSKQIPATTGTIQATLDALDEEDREALRAIIFLKDNGRYRLSAAALAEFLCDEYPDINKNKIEKYRINNASKYNYRWSPDE